MTDLKSNMDRFIVMEKIRCELPDVDLKSNMDRFIAGTEQTTNELTRKFKIQYG